MNCYFCQQPTKLSFVDTDSKGAPTLSIYECKDCQATFNYLHATESISDYFFLYREYQCKFFPHRPESTLPGPYFCLGKMLNAGAVNGYRYILRLGFLPSLTPSNVAQRLPLLLPFL